MLSIYEQCVPQACVLFQSSTAAPAALGGSGGYRAGTEPVGSIYGVSPSRADKEALALHRFPMSLEATGAQDILEQWGQRGKQ